MLTDAADALGVLVDEVVFAGGATLALWLSDAAAAPPRPTLDVDVIVEISTRTALAEFDGRLRDAGFKEDMESGVICRWRYLRDNIDLVLDVMPTDAGLLGFANRWQAAAHDHAQVAEIANDRSIRAAGPPYLLAMKIDAFESRGQGDYLASRDLEDIVALVDGRPEIVGEIQSADLELRSYLANKAAGFLGDRSFLDSVAMHLRADAASQARAQLVVLPRLEQIAALAAA